MIVCVCGKFERFFDIIYLVWFFFIWWCEFVLKGRMWWFNGLKFFDVFILIINVFLLRNVLCVYLWMFMYYIKDLEFKKCKYVNVNVKYIFYNVWVI